MKKEKTKYINIILKNLQENKRIYILLLICLLIGIVLGVVFINNSDEVQKNEVNEYITNFVTTLKSNNSIDKNELINVSLKRNILMGIILWFIGSTIIGLPLIYFFILYKGICIGYTISGAILALGTGRGVAFCLGSILFQNIIFIPALFFITVSSTKLCYAIMKNRTKENIKLEIVKHSILSAITIILFMLSSLLEVYISTNLLTFITKYI